MAAPVYIARRGGAAITATSGTIPFTGATIGNFCLVVVLQDGTGAALSGISTGGVANLAGTANSLTAIRAGASAIQVGSPAAGKGYVWVGRFTAASGTINLTSPGDDMYGAVYEFSGVNAGTALSDVIENVTAGADAVAFLTGTTISDVAVQTLGADRLAINCCFLTDDGSGLAAFAGSSGGTWVLSADGTFASATGTDGTVAMMTAAMASAGTIDGGTDTIVSLPWAVSGFALKPVAGGPAPTPINLSVALTLAVSVTRTSINRNVALALTLVPTVLRPTISRFKSLALTLTPSVTRVVDRKLATPLTLAVTASRILSKAITVPLTLVPSVTALKSYIVNLSVPLTLAPTVTRTVNRVVPVPLTLVPTVQRVVSRSLSVALSLPVTVSRVIDRKLTTALTLVPTVRRVVGRNLSLALSLPVTVSRRVNRTVAVALSLPVSIARTIDRKLSTPLTFGVTVTPTFVSANVVSINITVGLSLVPSVSLTFVPAAGGDPVRITWSTAKGWLRRSPRRRIDP